MPIADLASKLSDLSQTQRERLAYIEVKAYFCGELTRSDIEKRFGVKPAASSRDLATYREIAPGNLTYEPSLRRHVPDDAFKPVFSHSPQRVLHWLQSGTGDGLDLGLKLAIPCESASELVSPDLGILSVITRAIAAKRLVKIEYLSMSSGKSTCILAPVALADTGLRWHLRAFDRARSRFSDFVLTRIVKAESMLDLSEEGERLESDIQWARVVRLELGAHPGLRHPRAVEADYGMKDGTLTLDLRAPLVGYALRRWAVDCSEDLSLDHKSHHLCLKNRATLYGVESAALAPGYVPEKGTVNGPL